MARARRVPVPQRASDVAGLDRVDYADSFVVTVSASHTPEEWIRLIADAKPALFGAVRLAHRALGLPLAPKDSSRHVIGWDVLSSTPDVAVLGNTGILGAPRIVGLAQPGQVVLATLIEFDGTVGRMLWCVAAPIHRAVSRYALGALQRAHEGSMSAR